MTRDEQIAALAALRDARELISVPERWTQHAYARDRWNLRTADTSDAVKWCGDGALRKTAAPRSIYRYAVRVLQVRAPRGIVATNDGPNGHAEILAVYDRAIAWLEQEIADAAS